jgi:RHS repeat-associated protein
VDLVEWTPSVNPPVAALAEGLDTDLDVITYGDADWALSYVLPYYGGDCVRSGQIDDEEYSEMQITVGGEGTLTFWWRAYSESNDAMSFYIDDVERCDPISGDEHIEWEEKSFVITGEGNHKLEWRYAKNGWRVEGDDCGYVDYLQWTGGGPIPPPEPPEPPEPEWQTVSYTYDAAGRRIEKKVDGVVEVKYVYDGDHVIAEYDGSDNLLRKYVYGPSIDEPICMIESSGDYSGTYYYHFDALGSVVALTNGAGTAVQLYEYSVYGQVSASDPNHPNRFMFTGREFDKDTGLYYYRARYYNPEIGRFLQTDPIGYGDGMNWYAYCKNNPIGYIDPSGLCDICGDPGNCALLYPGIDDPCFTLVTGKIMVLPYRLDPAYLSALGGLDDLIDGYKNVMDWKGRFGLAIDIWNKDWDKILRDKVKSLANPTSKMVSMYIDALQGFIDVLPEIVDKTAWRAFIEIQDWKVKRGGDKQDEKGFTLDENGHRIVEKAGKPYWVEVVGLEEYWPTGGAPGYKTAEHAYAAALKGISFWKCYKLGHRVPDSWWTKDPYMGHGSIYAGHYYFDGDVPAFAP